MAGEPEGQKECTAPDERFLRDCGIPDAHDFKRTWRAKPLSHWDICFCKDGSVVIRAHGLCGKSVGGIGTSHRWK